jgi:hypothetical protein
VTVCALVQLVDLLQLIPLGDASAKVGPIQQSISHRNIRAVTVMHGSFSPDLTAPPDGMRWEMMNLTAWCAPHASQGLRASKASVTEAYSQGGQPPDQAGFLLAAPPSFRAGMTSKMPLVGRRRKGARWFLPVAVAAVICVPSPIFKVQVP